MEQMEVLASRNDRLNPENCLFSIGVNSGNDRSLYLAYRLTAGSASYWSKEVLDHDSL